MKECALLSPTSDKAQISPRSDTSVALYIHGITIEIPPAVLTESLRAAARVLERLADDTDHPPELMGS